MSVPANSSFSVRPTRDIVSDRRRQDMLSSLRFGELFTDHMVTIDWTEERGWHDAQVRPREPFLIDPASAVLHYGQEIFEGMKAYRQADGGVALFRPAENARRFARSATRMAMPELPTDLFLEAVEQLVRLERAWVPEGDGALYLRPFMFANEPFLGMRAARRFIFCVIAAPVGAYFSKDADRLSLWVSGNYSRAAPGGTGAAKCGGNYAGSLIAQAEALANGCDQVVFLDPCEKRWVEEVGAMNIFFVMADGSIVTPPLGTILDGITRSSIIALARDAGHRVSEERYGFDHLRADAAGGRLAEIFVCGTAASVVGVEEVRWAGGSFRLPRANGGVAPTLGARLSDIQQGRGPDPFNWSWVVR